MKPEQQKKHNSLFGAIFLFLGLMAWAGSGYFVVVPRIAKPAPVVGVRTDIPSCQSALTEMGYFVSDKSDVIVAFEPLTAAPREQLEKASAAATLCHLPMVNFCMGEGCERPGLTLQISKTSEGSALDSATTAKSTTGKPVAEQPKNLPVKK